MLALARREVYATAVRNARAFHSVETLKEQVRRECGCVLFLSTLAVGEQNEAFDGTTGALRALRLQARPRALCGVCVCGGGGGAFPG